MEIARRKWWHDKVIYEIYPKSFCDSDGDGIGDLGGILSKMDYLEELGVDILWICPCFRSPFVDQGYDVSNYYEIDPVFGTNEQMEQILAEAKRRGMNVIGFAKPAKSPTGNTGNTSISSMPKRMSCRPTGGAILAGLYGHRFRETRAKNTCMYFMRSSPTSTGKTRK